MDYGQLKGYLSLAFMAFAIVGVSWWAFAPRRRSRFNDAANLPFADEDINKNTVKQAETASEKEGDL
ncbi:MAG: cytochrome c oxidase cbb3-type subunit 4 [Flavobacteriales bacterium]|jgi:cytochrome c oxidase cbb3-type subunit 4